MTASEKNITSNLTSRKAVPMTTRNHKMISVTSLFAATTILATLLTASPASAIPIPLGFWDFEEGSGTTTADKTGNLNTGTLRAGMVWDANGAPGGSTPGGSLNFSGTNNHVVDIPGIPINMLGNTTGYTIAGWLSPDNTDNDNFYFGSSNQGVHHGQRGGGTPSFAHWGNDFNGTTQVPTGASSDPNSWVHVAYTYDPVSDDAFIYYNGALDTSGNEGGPNNSTGVFLLGGRNGGTETFDGSIDDVGVWNSILPLADIEALAAGASPFPAAGVPEPSTLVLAGLGLLSLVAFRRRRRRA
jgi:hypothetical protein